MHSGIVSFNDLAANNMLDLASCYPYVPQQEVLLRKAVSSTLESGDYSTYGPVGGDTQALSIVGRTFLGIGNGRGAALTSTGQSALTIVLSVLCGKPGARVAVEDRHFPLRRKSSRGWAPNWYQSPRTLAACFQTSWKAPLAKARASCIPCRLSITRPAHRWQKAAGSRSQA